MNRKRKYLVIGLVLLTSLGSSVLQQLHATDEDVKREPEAFVRAYYDALERGDIDAIVSKWMFPNKANRDEKNLRRIAKNYGGGTINELRSENENSSNAEVFIDVTAKPKNKKIAQERWKGIIELEKVVGEWKFTKMNLTKSVPNSKLNLLFYHQPSGCSHCNYQVPVIREFQQKHPDINVMWRPVGSLQANEGELIKGTSGHPIMVLFEGEHTKRIIGEASLEELEKYLEDFHIDIQKAKSTTNTPVNEIKRSGSTCGG